MPITGMGDTFQAGPPGPATPLPGLQGRQPLGGLVPQRDAGDEGHGAGLAPAAGGRQMFVLDML